MKFDPITRRANKVARSRTITGAITESLRFFGRKFSAISRDGRRMLAAAALLHLVLAVGLFGAGRAQVAPGLIDRDGIMSSFAFDSYKYQARGARLAEVFRQKGLLAWVAEREPVHIKVISVQFALLGPLFGYGTLSAEPFNLFCYLAVVGLTFALGREVGGARAGLLAAAVVALWPTLLLHTLQILKDPLFIAGALTLVLCVTTWLTRGYGPRGAIVTGTITAVAISLLLLIRSSFAVVIFTLVLFAFVLLAIRQLVEGRALYWNMACPLLILAAGVLLLVPSRPAHGGEKFKHYPSDQGGQPKAVPGVGLQVPTIVSYVVSRFEERPATSAGPLDRMAFRIGTVRHGFITDPASGSNIDSDVELIDPVDLFRYLPRAFEVGCWAPFPNTWLAAGKRVGSAGKLLSGAETLFMYMFELLALVAVLRPPRRLVAWLLLSITVFGVTLLGLVVPNLGALYRFRYTFGVLLIILGAKGFEALLRRRELINRAAAGVALACLLATVCSCSSQAGRTRGGADGGLRSQGAAQPSTTDVPAGGLGFDLVNFMGAKVRAVYISRSDSMGWEENVLGADELNDGDSVKIRFSPEERAALWDIRVESPDGLIAEWKGLDLRGASRVSLGLNLVGELLAVAKVRLIASPSTHE